MDGTRERIVEALRTEPELVPVQRLAELTGLHPGTLRSHLPAMVSAGLVHREDRPGPGAGRPTVYYGVGSALLGPDGAAGPNGATHPDGAADSSDERITDYRMLAEALADAMTTAPRSGTAAYQAGRRWAAANAEPAEADPDQADPHVAVAEVVRLLEEQGLDPRLAPNGRDITIRRCPFEQLALSHREIVCQAHIGAVSGAVDSLESPVCVMSFQPLRTEEPLTCQVRLGPTRRD